MLEKLEKMHCDMNTGFNSVHQNLGKMFVEVRTQATMLRGLVTEEHRLPGYVCFLPVDVDKLGRFGKLKSKLDLLNREVLLFFVCPVPTPAETERCSQLHLPGAARWDPERSRAAAPT